MAVEWLALDGCQCKERSGPAAAGATGQHVGMQAALGASARCIPRKTGQLGRQKALERCVPDEVAGGCVVGGVHNHVVLPRQLDCTRSKREAMQTAGEGCMGHVARGSACDRASIPRR